MMSISTKEFAPLLISNFIDLVGMVEKLIKENMSKPQDQEAYAKKHSSLENITA